MDGDRTFDREDIYSANAFFTVTSRRGISSSMDFVLMPAAQYLASSGESNVWPRRFPPDKTCILHLPDGSCFGSGSFILQYPPIFAKIRDGNRRRNLFRLALVSVGSTGGGFYLFKASLGFAGHLLLVA